jgi:thiamine kinase-like enzyme
MKNQVKYIALPFLLLLISCNQSHFDEQSAEDVIKKELLIKGNLSTKEVKGGHGGNLIYFSTDGKNRYIIKFFKNKKSGVREIYNSHIASKEGIGPKVYFSDSSKGILVMEYLDGRKISKEDLNSDKICIFLAHLLQKIHEGERFDNFEYDPFKRIKEHIRLNKPKYNHLIPLDEIERIAKSIERVLTPYLEKIPCHNDLHHDNLIFLENEVKAIDYADAGQNDLYFDVATIANSALVYSNSLSEEVLFKTYLRHIPSKKEKAKLYLMKQIVLIKWGLDALNRASRDEISRYQIIEAPSLHDIAKEVLEKSFDLGVNDHDLIFLKALINQILKNAKSEEFENALNF